MEPGHARRCIPIASSSETIMAALLVVDLAATLARAGARSRREQAALRLAFLLLSPPRFSLALARLRAMPLQSKAELLGRFLIRSPSCSSRAVARWLPPPAPHPRGPSRRRDPASPCVIPTPTSASSSSFACPVDWYALVDDTVRSASPSPASAPRRGRRSHHTSTRPLSVAVSQTWCRRNAQRRAAGGRTASGAGARPMRPSLRCPTRQATGRRA
ncbi:hypothetical protein GUJ93_ZPchr0005g15974 [Zizania palustris]|uniref:Uncharacterized protein n=1 Tax=Zizania palustris TaxID=103762 RepID=A0A8J5SBT5_ZIZPA|nr:hypothetical protein GUJ93_ZPchr0005g15974 [Zizania palustris]